MLLRKRHPMLDSSSRVEAHEKEKGRRGTKIRYVHKKDRVGTVQRCHNRSCTAWQRATRLFPPPTRNLSALVSLSLSLSLRTLLLPSPFLFLPPVHSRAAHLFLPLTHPVKKLGWERDSRLRMPRKAQSLADCAPVHLGSSRGSPPRSDMPLSVTTVRHVSYISRPRFRLSHWRCVDHGAAASDRHGDWAPINREISAPLGNARDRFVHDVGGHRCRQSFPRSCAR